MNVRRQPRCYRSRRSEVMRRHETDGCGHGNPGTYHCCAVPLKRRLPTDPELRLGWHNTVLTGRYDAPVPVHAGQLGTYAIRRMLSVSALEINSETDGNSKGHTRDNQPPSIGLWRGQQAIIILWRR